MRKSTMTTRDLILIYSHCLVSFWRLLWLQCLETPRLGCATCFSVTPCVVSCCAAGRAERQHEVRIIHGHQEIFRVAHIPMKLRISSYPRWFCSPIVLIRDGDISPMFFSTCVIHALGDKWSTPIWGNLHLSLSMSQRSWQFWRPGNNI